MLKYMSGMHLTGLAQIARKTTILTHRAGGGLGQSLNELKKENTAAETRGADINISHTTDGNTRMSPSGTKLCACERYISDR